MCTVSAARQPSCSCFSNCNFRWSADSDLVILKRFIKQKVNQQLIFTYNILCIYAFIFIHITLMMTTMNERFKYQPLEPVFMD